MRRTRKYKKKHTRLGKYKSSLEALVAKKLPKGSTYEGTKLQYFEVKNYIPDFVVRTRDNRTIYLEVKGFLRYEDQRKMKMVKLSNPELDIRFYFPSDNKVHRSKMTNAQWCKKHDFPYCIGSIPKEWF